MDLTWFQNLIYGAVSGAAEILPVSAQAHRLILRKIFGSPSVPGITLLLIHIGIFAAVYLSCQNQILRILRAKRLSRIPKKKRKRPLDAISLMDYSLLRTMLIPIILGFFFYQRTSQWENMVMVVAGLLFLNGIILYLPQFLPGSNKDSRTLSRVEGLLTGLGAATAVLPGISGIGVSYSVGQICGMDRTYGFNMAMLLEQFLLVGLLIMDVLGILGTGFGGLTFTLLLQSILAALAAFGGALLCIRFLRRVVTEHGFGAFAYYCWGVALFSIILTMFA